MRLALPLLFSLGTRDGGNLSDDATLDCLNGMSSSFSLITTPVNNIVNTRVSNDANSYQNKLMNAALELVTLCSLLNSELLNDPNVLSN
jgi:hypothetical protein